MKNKSDLLILLLLFLALPLFSQKSPQSWSIVASYTIPGKASGLAWDGTYIYFGMYWSNGNQVYKFDPSNGNYNLQCTGSFSEAYGLTFKGPNLVTVNQPSSSAQPSQALEFNMSGTTVSTITLADHYMSGIAWDNGNYWVCTYYPDPGIVYHINGSGTVLSQFVPPNNQPWDICMQGTDLWIADYNANMLYKVTTTGTLLDSHASQGIKPSGIVYDGTYLWYCDGQLGQNSTLYKVDLLGSGTPGIMVPVTSHDYGTVTTGNSSTWNCQVQNTGTANLVITSVGIPAGQPVTTNFSVPATVAPSNSVNIPLTYSPTSAGSLNTQVSINSNDPINPSVLVTLTGNSVYPGPHITTSVNSHDYGERRKNAYSRWFLPVTNNGDQPLILSGLSLTDNHFTIDPSVTLPLTINTLQTVKIGIWFHPTEGISYSGILNIASNDPSQNPYPVSLSGMGVDTLYPLGAPLWYFMINAGSDNSPKSIVPGPDITGDGVADVIIGSEDDYIRCFNGNSSADADVLWETFIYAGAVNSQNCIAIIDDINNDGIKDVIVGTAWGDRSIIALSGKTGLQLWKHDTHEYGSGGWVYQVDCKYDYNGDGFPDVLAATGDDGGGTGPRRIYCLNGLTGIPVWQTPTGGADFSVLGVEDFTNDGHPDAIAGGTSASQSLGKIYGIDGTNGSIKWTHTPPGSSVWALLQIDDFTGDGIKDFVSGDFSGNMYYHNSVSGAMVLSYVIPNSTILRFVKTGDVNHDGHPDFLIAHSGTNGIEMDGHTNTVIWSKPLADKTWNVADMGDVTWDGTDDVIIGTLYTDNYTYCMDGENGDIKFQTNTQTPVDAINSIPDIAGDQTREMVIGGRNGAVYCLSGGYDPSTGIKENNRDKNSLYVKIYPNPFVEDLTIEYDLPENEKIRIVINDILGRQTGELNDLPSEEGHQIFRLSRHLPDGHFLTPGVYIFDFVTSSTETRKKVILSSE